MYNVVLSKIIKKKKMKKKTWKNIITIFDRNTSTFFFVYIKYYFYMLSINSLSH